MQKFEEREAITLTNQGEKIFAILHRPLEKTKVPAVLICSGFAGTKSGKFRLFVTLGQELAKRGIAVLRFDYRGAGDSEGEFEQMSLEGKVSDTLTCLDFLAKDSQIDNTRIGLLGRSLGGAIAVLAASQCPSIKSLALWAPVFTSDPWKKIWELIQSNPTLYSTHEVLKNLPAHIPNKEFLEQFFSLNLEQKLTEIKNIPLLHIHGEKDTIVKLEHAKAYKKARECIENTKFVVLPHSDHDFSDESERKIALQETIDWFEKTLIFKTV
jgi:alpha-beta hydrolase superfamily lysophospholipase